MKSLKLTVFACALIFCMSTYCHAQSFSLVEFQGKNKGKVVFVEAFPNSDKLSSEARARGSGVVLKGGYVLTAGHFEKSGPVTGPSAMVFTGRMGGVEETSYRLFYVGKIPDHDLLLFQFDAAVKIASFACRRDPRDVVGSGEPIVIIGFPRAAYDVGGYQSAQHILDVQSGAVSGVGAGRIFTATNVTYGQSGAPVFDGQGRVIGIVRGEIKAADGAPSGLAVVVPIERAEPILPHIATGATPAECGVRLSDSRIIDRRGRVAVSVWGQTGALLKQARRTGEIGTAIDISAQGGEQSDCDPASGRTISSASAVASVNLLENKGLTFSHDLEAQGGHYRTSSLGGCVSIGGSKYLQGIQPHDTDAYAEVTATGEIEFTVGQQTETKISWRGMKEATMNLIEVRSPGSDPSLPIDTMTLNGTGEKSAKLLPNRQYRTIISYNTRVQHRGAADRPREFANPQLGITFSD